MALSSWLSRGRPPRGGGPCHASSTALSAAEGGRGGDQSQRTEDAALLSLKAWEGPQGQERRRPLGTVKQGTGVSLEPSEGTQPADILVFGTVKPFWTSDAQTYKIIQFLKPLCFWPSALAAIGNEFRDYLQSSRLQTVKVCCWRQGAAGRGQAQGKLRT